MNDVEKNRKLPLWLNYQIKSGILIFNGKPDHYDIGVYNIQLIDRSNFIVRAFSIEVMAYPRPKTMIEIKRTLTDVEEVKWELTDENINKNQVK